MITVMNRNIVECCSEEVERLLRIYLSLSLSVYLCACYEMQKKLLKWILLSQFPSMAEWASLKSTL